MLASGLTSEHSIQRCAHFGIQSEHGWDRPGVQKISQGLIVWGTGTYGGEKICHELISMELSETGSISGHISDKYILSNFHFKIKMSWLGPAF